MRAWFLWGLIVCCGSGAGGAWAQGCTEIDGVERTARDLLRSRTRPGGILRSNDGPTGRSFDVGQIAVLEDDGAGELIFHTKKGDPTIDIPAISRRFYRTHPDDYDFMAVFTCFPVVDPITEGPFSAYSLLINNDIRGIHLPDLNYCEDFGSAGNLEGILSMNNFADPRYRRGPYDRLPGNNDSTMSLLAHETGHRWAARVQVNDGPPGRIHRSDALLGRAFSHWNFYLHTPTLMGASSLEGNYWQFDGLGNFTTLAETDGYCPLDQYLMGVRTADEVPPFFVVDGSHVRTSGDQPEPGVREPGRFRWFTVRDIMAVEGRRLPGLRSAEGAWREAFVLVVPKGYPETHAQELMWLIDELDAVRKEFEYYFFESTEGRGSMRTGLTNTPTPLYRLFSPDSGVHFYTAGDEEFFEAVAFNGYQPEGAVGRVFPTQAAGTVPIYRLFHPTIGHHFYTTDPFEREGAISHGGYVPEGVSGYVYPDPLPGTIPFYRMYHYGMADHFYTTDADEVERAIAAGYVLEGVLGYLLPDALIPEAVR